MLTSSLQETLILRPFQPQDQDAAKGLILDGLVEHWGFLDSTLNPDLNDIAHAYANGCFLTAWQEKTLIGTGAFLPVDEQTIQIVRMSVRKSHRRLGVGKQILDALLQEATRRGYRRAILETTATWTEVIAFYLRCGFVITHHAEGDVYFERWL